MAFTVRLAERRDAGAIRAIYNLEVAESTVTFDLVPRMLDEQVEWIDAHSGAHPAVVAADEAGEVVGFGSLSPFKDRPAYSRPSRTPSTCAATGAAGASAGSCSGVAQSGTSDGCCCTSCSVASGRRKPGGMSSCDSTTLVIVAAPTFQRCVSMLTRGPGWIRTNVAVTQRVYSPSPLASRVPTRI